MKPETIVNAYDKAKKTLRYGVESERERLTRQVALFRARILSRMGRGMKVALFPARAAAFFTRYLNHISLSPIDSNLSWRKRISLCPAVATA